MAYEDHEVSVEASLPVELVDISIGSDIYRLVNQYHDVDVAGDTYYSHPITHGRITTGEETVIMEMDAEHAFPKLYTTSAPGRVASMTIRAQQRNDPTDIKVIYKGIVRTVSFTEDMTQARIAVIPITAAFDKEIPDRTYQNSCNHVLFTNECSVNQFLYRHQGIVTAVVGNVVTVAGLGAKGTGWATGGFTGFGTEDYRMILDHTGNDMTLNLAFYGDVVGQVVDVYAGCDHLLATCGTKFSNTINFGGCPYVPTKNIFQTGID